MAPLRISCGALTLKLYRFRANWILLCFTALSKQWMKRLWKTSELILRSSSSIGILHYFIILLTIGFIYSPAKNPYPDNEYNALQSELAKYLTTSGLHSPLAQIYIASKPIEDLEFILALFVLSQASAWKLHPSLGMIFFFIRVINLCPD